MTVSFDKRLAELDAYLQMLIQELETIDIKLESANSETERASLHSIRSNLDTLLGTIKHAIVLLQIAKVSIRTSPLPQEKQSHNRTSLHSTSSSSSLSRDKREQLTCSTTEVADRFVTSSLNSKEDQLKLDTQQIASPKPPARALRRQLTPKQQLQEQVQRNLLSHSSGSFELDKQQQIQQIDSSANNTSPFCSSSYSSERSQAGVRKESLVSSNNSIDDQHTQATSILRDGATSSSHAARLNLSEKDDYDDEDDDDAFFDAAGEQELQQQQQQQQQQQKPKLSSQSSVIEINENKSHQVRENLDSLDYSSMASQGTMPTLNNNNNNNTNNNNNNNLPIVDSSIDWDALYDEEEEDLGSLENQGSVIKHLMSQIRIGMDLTKVVLPTFILERRSLLEMYADFFAHPDLFSSIPDYETPEERFVQLVKWYLSAFHAGRKSSVAKKPYNPILGEIFLCHWNLTPPNNQDDKSNSTESHELMSSNEKSKEIERTNLTESTTSVNDIEKFSKQLPTDSLLFVAEQVSHHPPVSAFYAENPSKQISCTAHIYTKSKYLGLSVGVHNVGQGIVNLLKHNETYICTFPSAYGRSILTVPWVELGGAVTIGCKETGYIAKVEFVTKPFYGGKKHRIVAELLRPNKEPFMSIEGEWNGCMYSKSPPNSNNKDLFIDTTCLPVIKKNVRSIGSQESFESRNVWKEVTRALKLHDVTSATAAKSFIEQRQRDLLKDRIEKGTKWKTRYFEPMEDGWTYGRSLENRKSEETSIKE